MTDVGKARVEVVGDVRNFARETERELNEAIRRIKPDAITIPLDLRDARSTGHDAGDEAANGFVQGFVTRLAALHGILSAAGRRAGDAVGDGFQRGLNRKTDGADKFANNTLKRITDILGKGMSGIGSVIGPVLGVVGTVVGTLFSTAFVAVAAGVIGPTLAAAITSALALGLGAGLIGLAALALKDLKPLQNAFKSFGETIKDVGHEAAKPLLKPLINALKGLSELARELKGDFKGIFKDLAPAIEPLVDAIGVFLGEVVRGLSDSMPGIVAAFEGLSRALPIVGRWLGDFFRTIFENDELIDNTTEGLMKLVFGPLKLLGPIISGLNVAFGVWNNLMRLMAESDVLGQLGQSLLDFVDGGTGAIDRIKNAWGPLGEAIQKVWDKIKAFAGEDDPGKLADRFQEAIDAIKEAWGPFKDFIETVWNEALAAIKRVWEEEFIPWWEETAVPWLKEAMESAFRMAWDAAVKVTGDRIDSLQALIREGMSRVPGIAMNAIAALPGVVGRTFHAAANMALSGALRLVGGVVRALSALPGRIGSVLSSVRRVVTGAFAGAAGWLVGAGRNIINGLISGIQSGFSRVRGLLNDLTGMLPDWKGPAAVDRMILRESGQMVMRGFEQGILDQRRALRSTLAGITGDLPGWSAGGAYGVSRGATSTSSLTIMPGAIVIHASGQAAAEETATAVLERLAQANLVRGR